MVPLPLVALVLLGAAPLQVQAGAPLGGNGSAERPFAHLAEALALAPADGVVAVGPGLYEESLRIERAVQVRASPGAVLAAPPGAAFALQVQAAAVVEGLAVQGGRTGIAVVRGALKLRRARLQGQPEVAVAVAAGARLDLEQVQLQCSLASAVGARVEGELRASDLEVSGPFRRALEVLGGTLSARGVTLVGAGTGVHAEQARVELSGLEVRGVRGSALFASASEVALREPLVQGGEVALEIRDGTRLRVAGGILVAASRAAIAAVASHLTVADTVCSGPFTHAAIEVVGGEAVLSDVRLHRPGEVGVLGRLATLSFARLVIDGAKANPDDGGNGLFLYDCKVEGAELLARGCEGPAVEAQLGSGRITSTLVEQPGIAGVALEHGATLELLGLELSGGGGAGLACIEQGRARLRLLRLQAARPFLVDASCRVDCRPPGACPVPP